MYIHNVVIEVTRVCNMVCDHCLRGKAEKRYMPTEYMNQFVEQITSIGNVTFTGGEPGLGTAQIREFLTICRNHNIDVESFYIATNGTVASDEFIRVLMDWYLYCDNTDDLSRVDISNDQYHDLNQETINRLRGLSFVGNKHSEIHPYQEDWNINEGYWRMHSNTGREITPSPIELEVGYTHNTIYEGEIYLNCRGNIINGCNLSFESQERRENIVCHVSDFSIDAIEAYNDKYFPEEEVA